MGDALDSYMEQYGGAAQARQPDDLTLESQETAGKQPAAFGAVGSGDALDQYMQKYPSVPAGATDLESAPVAVSAAPAPSARPNAIDAAVNIGGDISGALVGGAIGGAVGGAASTMFGPAAPLAAEALVPAGAELGQAAGVAGVAAYKNLLRDIMGKNPLSPSQQMNDVAKTFVLQLAGGKLLGDAIDVAKTPTGALVDAAKFIGKNTSDFGKELIAKTLAMGGAQPASIKTMFENAPEVMRRAGSFMQAAGKDPAVASASAKDAAIDSAKQLLEKATDALPQKYGQQLYDLLSNPKARNMVVDMRDVVNSASKKLEDSGYGRLIEGEDGSLEFQPFSPAEMTHRAAQGLNIRAVPKDAQENVQHMAQILSDFSKVGEIRGGPAANMLTKMNQLINGASRSARAGGDPAYQGLIDGISDGFRSGVGAQFEKAGLSAEYTKGAQLYSDYANEVNKARDMLQQPQQIETLVNRLASESTLYRTSKNLTNKLVDLTGNEGQKLLNDIKYNNAAKDFVSWMPKKAGIPGSVASAAGTAAITGHPIAGAAAGATLPAFSPKAVGTATSAIQQTSDYLAHGLNFLGQLSKPQLSQFLRNDQALLSYVRNLALGPHQEEALKGALLRKSGAIQDDSGGQAQ